MDTPKTLLFVIRVETNRPIELYYPDDRDMALAVAKSLNRELTNHPFTYEVVEKPNPFFLEPQ